MAEPSTPKLSVSISRASVEGSKLVILSADLLLNFNGCVSSYAVALLAYSEGLLLSICVLKPSFLMLLES